MTHDEPTIQAAIDAAFLTNGDAHGGNLVTSDDGEYSTYWTREAPARLEVAKQFLAALPPAEPASEASQEVKPKHQKSYIVCARLDCPQAITHYEGSCPTCTARQEASQKPETFVTRGKTWTRHEPGDPMPCDGEAKIQILHRVDGLVNRTIYHAKSLFWGKGPDSPHGGYSSDIIGWRYADQPAPEPVVTRTFKDAIRATPQPVAPLTVEDALRAGACLWPPAVGDVVRLKSGGPEMTVTEHRVNLDVVDAGWFVGYEYCKQEFSVACLEPAGKEVQP